MDVRTLATALICAIVGSVLGAFCLAASVHGSNLTGDIGLILLFPVLMLSRAGVPVAIPLFFRVSLAGLLVFLGVQFVYYWLIILAARSSIRLFRAKRNAR